MKKFPKKHTISDLQYKNLKNFFILFFKINSFLNDDKFTTLMAETKFKSHN